MKVLQTAIIAAAVLAAGAAQAQQFRPDPNADIAISAGATDVKDCNSVWTGNVRVTQGKARILANSLTTRSAKRGDKCGEASKLELDRNVFYVTPDVTVRADHALYDLDADSVVFTGDVILTRPQGDVSTGSKLTVDLKTNDFNMQGPVRAFIKPKPQS